MKIEPKIDEVFEANGQRYNQFVKDVEDRLKKTCKGCRK